MTGYRVPPASWRGQYTDGFTALVHEVELTVDGEALVGRTAAAILFRWPLGRVRVAPAEDGRVTLTSPDAADATLTSDAEPVAAHAALTHAAAVRAAPGRWRSILTYTAGAVVVAALIYLNLDAVARVVARRVSPEYEAQLGDGLAALLARDYCETDAARAALERVAARLELPGDRAPRGLHVLDTPMVNAFTLPGGVVVVTRGLLDQAAAPDEVAGVLAHELEHVRQRHVMVHVVRGGILTALWQATVGDFSGLVMVDPRTAVDIANLHFSRDDEREADRGALERLDRGAISRAGFRAFFERMRAHTDQVPAWLSNHPASAERIGAIGGDVGAIHRTPALDAPDWAALKSGCVARRK